MVAVHSEHVGSQGGCPPNYPQAHKFRKQAERDLRVAVR